MSYVIHSQEQWNEPPSHAALTATKIKLNEEKVNKISSGTTCLVLRLAHYKYRKTWDGATTGLFPYERY